MKGSAQVGVNLGGSGSVSIDDSSLYGDDVVSSVQGGDAKTKHTFTFKKEGDRKVTTTLAPLTTGGNATASRAYRFRLEKPSYTWDLAITPGVKVTVEVKAKPFIDMTEVIGPFWLNAASVELGSIGFSAHAGTNTTVELKKGVKTFTPSTGRALPASAPR